MKKMMAVMALALAGVAGAQTWQAGEDLTMTYGGCKDTQNGVECTFNVSYVGAKDVVNVDICTNKMIAVLATGDSITADRKKFGSKDWMSTCDSTDIYKGIPLKLVALYSERSVKNIAKLNVYGKLLSVVPAQPAPAPAQSINIAGDWNATLTDCKQASAGVVVCTATLRK